MRMRRRWPRLVTFVSVTTMLVTPAIASAESPAARPAGFSSSRIPADSEFSNGPLSHINGGGSGSASESSSESDGASASPAMSDVNPNRSLDSQAP